MEIIYESDGKTVKAWEFDDFKIFKDERYPNKWLLTAPNFGISLKILGTTIANKDTVFGCAAYVLRMKNDVIKKAIKDIYDNKEK